MDLPEARALGDLELLQIEMDLLWGAKTGPELVLAYTRDSVRARIGNQVAPDVARALAAELDSVPPGVDSDVPPPQLERSRVLLEDALGAAVRLAPGSGPSYLIEPEVTFRATAELLRSDKADLAPVRQANPGNWDADEWQDLADGHLGPWVMAAHGERVISICHTPVFNSMAAEAGVWTHPDFRGQGHAAATTAEWAALMRPTGRLLFYSTSRTNRASRRVAARLGLRQLGHLWQLRSRSQQAGWADPRVRAGPCTADGSGSYAAAPIRTGEAVFVWGGGKVISDAELRRIAESGRRYRSASIDENQHIVWSADDPDAGGPGGANHSCDSNLWMLAERTVGARRDIAAVEELTLDYALIMVAPGWRMECHCGSRLCRGMVTGNDWQLPVLQERYAGHFSPFINARIAARRGLQVTDPGQ